MDVLRFECEHYKITISTNDVLYSWERFKRRVDVKSAMTYSDYKSSREGRLYLFDTESEGATLKSIGQETKSSWLMEPPVLFETNKYQFAIEFYSLANEEKIRVLPRLRHQLKSVNNSFKFYPNGNNSGYLIGTIDFLNSPGKFKFSFEFKDINNTIQHDYLELYVASPKLDTKNDLRSISQLINQEYENYVYDYLTLTFNSFELKKTERNNNIIWLSIFRTIINDYFKNVDYIITRPNSSSVNKVYHSRPHKIRLWSIHQEERYIDYGKDADNHYYRHNVIVNTINTIENRFVKYTLKILLKKFITVFSSMSPLYKDMDDSEKQELEDYIVKFQKRLSSSFFKKVGDFEGMKQESIILQQKTGYSRIYKCWLMLKSSLDLIEGQTNIGMKKIWELYEIWCFLVMKKLIIKILYSDNKISDDNIVENKYDLIDAFSNKEKTHIVRFKMPQNNDIITLEYQQLYTRKTRRIYSSTTIQKPDIVLSIHKSNGITLTYLYDAKYRVQDDENDCDLDENKNIDIVDYPIPDAINQMHRYRDAIYFSLSPDERPESKEIIGGYILYPGRSEGDKIKDAYFYKSIEKVNIGAFPVLPQTNVNINQILQSDLLENHLKKILSVTNICSHVGNSIPQKGLSYIYKQNVKVNTIVITDEKLRKYQLENRLFVYPIDMSIDILPQVKYVMLDRLYKLSDSGLKFVRGCDILVRGEEEFRQLINPEKSYFIADIILSDTTPDDIINEYLYMTKYGYFANIEATKNNE